MKFVKDSYDKHNEWAIEKVSQYLKHRGYVIHDKSEEDYGIDIVAEKNGKIINVEAEAKEEYPWQDIESFKFPTVSFLARKRKWKATNFWYFIVCRETDAMLVGNSDVIFRDEYLEHAHINKGGRNGSDSFYRVPKELLMFISGYDKGYETSYRP